MLVLKWIQCAHFPLVFQIHVVIKSIEMYHLDGPYKILPLIKSLKHIKSVLYPFSLVSRVQQIHMKPILYSK
jgi:hypothetical protein